MANSVRVFDWRWIVTAGVVAMLAACNGNDNRGEAPTAGSTEAPSSAADPAEFNAAVLAAADLITGAELRRHVAELADDRYEGRGPGSAGDALARAYLVRELTALGLEPGAADGAWQQPFSLVGLNATQPSGWTFVQGDRAKLFQQGSEFIVASGVQSDVARLSNAEVVFVGYGIRAPEYQWDDYKSADLKGKVLLMLNNDPDWDPDLFEGNRRLYYGRWTYKYEIAAEVGAVGAIIIHTNPSAGYPWQVVQTSWSGTQFELPARSEARVQVAAWLTETAAGELVSFAGHDLERLVESAKQRSFAPVPLGVTTNLELQVEKTAQRSANVLGLLPGRDPALKDQVVLVTAHHDHLGVAESGDGDRIYNGARDNASGTSVLLNIARAFVSSPPRRSMLFAFVGAEEQGLLGSKYYAQNPTFPPKDIAANINYDSSNIWGRTRDVTYIGLGKSDLDAVAHRIAEHQGRIVKGDQYPDQGSFYRSDQFSLARIGVPALYIAGGTDFIGREPEWGNEQQGTYNRLHYHQPSDELTDDWDFSGMIEDAQFGFLSGWIIANQDALPAWNAGDEFEAAGLARQ